MNPLCNKTEIDRIRRKFGFNFSKDFSQNFLIDESIPQRIAEAAAAGGNAFCLEIGPGIGALTYALCERFSEVAAVEVDRTLFPVLAETLGGLANFTLIKGDAGKLDLDAPAKKDYENNSICANLPYNITTKMVKKIAGLKNYRAAYLMLQREAAERLCAAPGSKEASEASYILHYFTAPRILFELPPECFMPRPAVTSVVIELRFKRDRQESAQLFEVIHCGFLNRRKTLMNNLQKIYGRERAEAAIKSIGMPLDVRGERLTLENYESLIKNLFTN